MKIRAIEDIEFEILALENDIETFRKRLVDVREERDKAIYVIRRAELGKKSYLRRGPPNEDSEELVPSEKDHGVAP